MTYGIITDISHHRYPIDFNMFYNAGIGGVIAKCTEGVGWKDPNYDEFWAEMTKWDFLRGNYHYFRMKYDPEEQAEYYHEQGSQTQLSPEVDVEKINNIGWSKVAFTESLHAHLLKVEELFGRKPKIYTGYYIWAELTTKPDWAADYELHLAYYSRYKPLRIPIPWTKWTLWQFSETYNIGGKLFDANLYNGTARDLYASANRTLSLARWRDEIERKTTWKAAGW